MVGGTSGGTGGSHAQLPPTPSVDDLLALADEPEPAAARWTRAGRALQKHGYRPTGSVYPRVTGPPAHYNSAARRIVEALLRDPRSTTVMRWRRSYGRLLPFIEVTAPDGRMFGYSWDVASSRFRFDGFREPPAQGP